MDTDNPMPRRWIFEGLLIRKYVSAFIGPGGVGKSSLAIAVGMSVALGKSLLALDHDDPHKIHKRGPVLYWNLEDPLEELLLRISGELKCRGINKAEIGANFLAMSGRDFPLNLVTTDAKASCDRRDITPIVQLLRDLGIILLIIDPYGNAHSGNPNDNAHMTAVLDQLRLIAEQADCAVLIVHHFRKGGQSGDAEASLGAVMTTNGCRVVDSITAMTEDEAKALGIDPTKRRSYVKRSNAKLNLSAAPDECEWYRFDGVSLDNVTDEYPDGDNVGVLTRWKALSPLLGLTWSDVSDILDQIDIGMGGEYYTSDPKSKTRWVGALMMERLGLDDQQAKSLIKEWIKAGILAKDKYISQERHGQDTQRLVVRPKGRDELTR